MGDSILFHWPPEHLPAPPGLHLCNRAVPGQHTGQMRLRFEAEAIGPGIAGVLLLGGTNDLRVEAGDPVLRSQHLLEQLTVNITAMADVAHAHEMPLALCAIPPVGEGRGLATRDPATIVRANTWLRGFAAEWGLPFADLHAALCDEAGLLRREFSQSDGIHLAAAGYQVAGPILGTALACLRPATPAPNASAGAPA